MSKFRTRFTTLSVLASLALFGSIAANAQVATSYNGILSVTWGDPKPGMLGGATRFELTEPNGTTHPLEIQPAQQSGAIQLFGKRVNVQGHANERAALGSTTIVVDDIVSAEPKNSDGERVRTVTTKKVLFLLLKFKGDPQLPHPVAFYKQLTNPLTPPAGSNVSATINGFFDKVSWGQLKFVASVGGLGGLNPTHWLTLPGTKHDYAACDNFTSSCVDANLTKLRTDGLALATANGIVWQNYDTINFVVNNDLDCCAWGGSFSNGVKSFGNTFEPPWAQHTETYVHELGHSLGLPHSGWRYYAYDSPWDIMSMHNQINVLNCGTYNSMNTGGANVNIGCPEPGSGYIVAYKDHLGWIPAANQLVISSKTTAAGKTVTLSAGATALGHTIKMIKICFPGINCAGRFLTVESKMAVGKFDNGAPHNGVIIHDVDMARGSISGGCYFNPQSGWAIPIDATPGDFNSSTCSPESFQGSTSGSAGLGNAQYGPGTVYKDVPHGITVKVKAQVTNGFTVTVIRSK